MHALNVLWQAHNEEVWLRRQRKFQNRRYAEPVEEMSESLFIQRLRLNKVVFRTMCKELRELGVTYVNLTQVCDSDLYITNVNAKFGGASHDSHIWSTSRIETYMRGLHQTSEQVWLLGDSGYPQRPWLMTPILNAVPSSREELYTQRLTQARNCIERCFGLLKARWRCLLRHRVLHYQPHVASKIVMACCVLHNYAIKARLPPPTYSLPVAREDEDSLQSLHSTVTTASELIQGRAALNCLLNRL